MVELFGDSLSDPRANIVEGDVADVIGSSESAFDAVLLDVDNGPEALIRKANDGLYDSGGLNAIHRALRPGGVLAVWSSGPNVAFSKRLRAADFGVRRSRRARYHQAQWRPPYHLARHEGQNRIKDRIQTCNQGKIEDGSLVGLHGLCYRG